MSTSRCLRGWGRTPGAEISSMLIIKTLNLQNIAQHPHHCEICGDPAMLLNIRQSYRDQLKSLKAMNAPKVIIEAAESALVRINFRLKIEHENVEKYLNKYYR